jgi:hypothetical protein
VIYWHLGQPRAAADELVDYSQPARVALHQVSQQRAASGHSRHIRDVRAMSASLPTPDILLSRSKRRSGAKSRLMHRSKNASLFDHLVGAQQDRGRHRQVQRLCCLHIHDQLKAGRAFGW